MFRARIQNTEVPRRMWWPDSFRSKPD